MQVTQFSLEDARRLVHRVRGQVLEEVVAEVAQVTTDKQVPDPSA